MNTSHPWRARTWRAVATAALTLSAAAGAWAQAYPAKAIKLVVPYAPGGSADIAARLITDEWGKALGGSLFIENKGGAGGNIGVDRVAKSAPCSRPSRGNTPMVQRGRAAPSTCQPSCSRPWQARPSCTSPTVVAARP